MKEASERITKTLDAVSALLDTVDTADVSRAVGPSYLRAASLRNAISDMREAIGRARLVMTPDYTLQE